MSFRAAAHLAEAARKTLGRKTLGGKTLGAGSLADGPLVLFLKRSQEGPVRSQIVPIGNTIEN